MWPPARGAAFFTHSVALKLALLFAVGLLILLYGSGPWVAIGALIVVPIVMTALFLAWAYIICKLVAACGGDPKDESTGILVFVSFAFFVVPLLVAFFRQHR
jgi:hypothetical protein